MPSAPALRLHPEDLGPADSGHPAFLWQLPELRLWASRWGFRRYRTHQCIFGRTKWPFPLNLLSTHPLHHRWFRPGGPRFQKVSGKHIGPLPRRCSCPPGFHARDDDYRGRNLRGRPDHIVQPGLLQSLSTLMLDLPQRNLLSAELLSRGTGRPLVRADETREEDNSSNDSTDAEEAELTAEDLGRSQSSADMAGQPAWDILALQARGFQDLESATGSGFVHHAKSEGAAGFGAEGRLRDHTDMGLHQKAKNHAKPDGARKDNGISNLSKKKLVVRHGSETAKKKKYIPAARV